MALAWAPCYGINDMPVGSANGKGPDHSLCSRIINGNLSMLPKHLQVELLIHTVPQAVPGFLADDTGTLRS